MDAHTSLIRRFYEAFDAQNAEAMASHYREDATFTDPVFRDLDAEETRDMWRMLCEADDLRVEVSEIVADDANGRARWDAWYTFTATGRKVHNIIYAEFTFRDGKIYRHRDRFDFWRWSRQAIGLPGLLLGWTPFLKNRVRSVAGKRLEQWRTENRA